MCVLVDSIFVLLRERKEERESVSSSDEEE